jgi:cytochrome c oxidase assembly protein subunit 15
MPGRSLSRWLVIALFLTFDLIMFGAFVRITDAGLGCPDWPGCYGSLTPFGAREQIAAESAVLPDGPVTVFKAWVEMLHRYVATGLVLIVIALAVMATRQARRSPGPRAPSVPLAWFTLVWIILQGLFGALTVTLKLMPLVVTGHLLGGMILFALLIVQWARVTGPMEGLHGAHRLEPWAWVAGAVLLVQIALGGWVSTNYATLACQDFPTCQGQWWPEMEFTRGFELWRKLGFAGDGQALPFTALTAIHFTHRVWAMVAFAVLGALAWRLRRIDGLRPHAHALLGLLALQAVTGLTNIFLDWPLLAAVIHTGGAAALLGVLLVVALSCRSSLQAGVAPARSLAARA